MEERVVGRQDKTPRKRPARFPLALPQAEIKALKAEADQKGVTITELVRAGVRLRDKIRAFDQNRVVLATEDPEGQLTKIAPISVLL